MKRLRCERGLHRLGRRSAAEHRRAPMYVLPSGHAIPWSQTTMAKRGLKPPSKPGSQRAVRIDDPPGPEMIYDP